MLNWLPNFRLATLLAFMTTFCLLLSLNVIPRIENGTVTFFNVSERFRTETTYFGWPYAFTRKLTGGNVPAEHQKDFYAYRKLRDRTRLIDNALIILVCSIATAAGIELFLRYFNTSLPHPQNGG